MLVSWGVQTLTGAAQPVMGDVLTAALALPVDGVDPIVTVGSTAKYQAAFRFTVEPGTANQDTYRIIKILSGTTMQCSLEGVNGHTHANGSIIQLAINAADVVVSPVTGNAAAMVIGADATVTAVPGGSAIKVLQPATAPAQGNEWRMTMNSQYNSVNTAEAWMIGTAADKVLVYALVI